MSSVKGFNTSIGVQRYDYESLDDKLEKSAITEVLDPAKSYAAGDTAIHQGKLYKRKTAGSGAWNAADWDLTSVLEVAANAEEVAGEIADLKEDLNNWNGNKAAIESIASYSGYALTSYRKEAWNYISNTKSNVNNVVMSDFITYNPGETISVLFPSNTAVRVTFTKDYIPVANSGWKESSPFTLSNSLDVNGFTIEIRWLDSTVISHTYDLTNAIKIIVPTDDTYVTNKQLESTNKVVEYWNGNKSIVKRAGLQNGYVISNYRYGAWSGSTIISNVKNVIISDINEYINNEKIIVSMPAGYRVRFTFVKNGQKVHGTGWYTAETNEYAYSNADGFTVEFTNANTSEIDDIYDFIDAVKVLIPERIPFLYTTTYEKELGGTRNLVVESNCLDAYLDASNAGRKIVANVHSKMVWIECEQNSYYTISKRLTSRFAVGSCSSIPEANVSLINVAQNNNAESITLNTGEGANYLCAWIFFDTYDTNFTFSDVLQTLQIEKSRVPTEYVKTKSLIDSVARYESVKYQDEITTIGIFDKWATIGDSFSVGRWYTYDGSTYTAYKTTRLAWGAILAREVGNTFLSLGVGGINTRTWLTVAESSGGGLAKALNSPKQELYFLCLGINDTSLGASYIGEDSDINDSDYTQNADTFYGNYGRIIQRMKEYSPNCLFIISKLVAWNNPSVRNDYDVAIEGIASHFGIPCINPFDDIFFSSNFYQTNRAGNNGHPTGMLYGGMAMAYKRLINKCIYDNPAYFVNYNGTADSGGNGDADA